MIEKRICTACKGTMNSAGRRGGKKKLRCTMCGKTCLEGNKARYTVVKQAVKASQTPKSKLKKSKTYVVTYAQNACSINKPFLKALKKYCSHNDAELVVIAGKHRFSRTRRWWDEALTPYLFDGNARITPNLRVRGDLAISPAVLDPLTSPDLIARDSSALVGHTKVRFLSMASIDRESPRIVASTGCITEPMYGNSFYGKKSESLHKYAATVIEIGKPGFHMRQLCAVEDGSFIDLDKRYTGKKVTKSKRALALVCGDIHVEKSDDKVLQATLTGDESIASVVRPEKVIYHDVLDFEVRNHHKINDPFVRACKANGLGEDCVEEEVMRAVAFLDEVTPKKSQGIVVASNHDEAFDRWLKTADPRMDPKNAKFFHKMCYLMLENIEENSEHTPAFELFYREHGNGSTRFLKRDEKLEVAGIVCSFHGDKGTNGSRGSLNQYTKLGVKVIIGHSHSPGIKGSAYQVGVTGNLDMGYNLMPSSWLNSHCVVYANGERSLINVIEGKWRK